MQYFLAVFEKKNHCIDIYIDSCKITIAHSVVAEENRIARQELARSQSYMTVGTTKKCIKLKEPSLLSRVAPIF